MAVRKLRCSQRSPVIRSYILLLICGTTILFMLLNKGSTVKEPTSMMEDTSDLNHERNFVSPSEQKIYSDSASNRIEAIVDPLQPETPLANPASQDESAREAELQQNTQTYAKSKYAMLYMEPRQIDDAMYVLNNFHGLMPPDWDLLIVCSSDNQAFMRERTDKLLGNREVRFLPILPAKFTKNLYNKLFLQVQFWDQILYDTVLVFQSDSILCANSPHRIEDFMHYKYLGCASGLAYGDTSHTDWSPRVFYGSGGLTVRNVQFHKDCLNNPVLSASLIKPKEDADGAEDVFYSKCAHEAKDGDRAENVSVLQQFCTQEGLYQPSFGIHKFWDQGYRLAPSHTRKIIAHCPEILPLHKEVIAEPAWNDTSIPEVFNVTKNEELKKEEKLRKQRDGSAVMKVPVKFNHESTAQQILSTS